jgi:hypothetical protein
MEVSFNTNPSQPSVPVEPQAAVAGTPIVQNAPVAATPPPAAPQVPAVRNAQPVGKADNFLMGDFLPSFADIILPRLSLSQNIGTLKESFLPGSVVLDRKVALFIPPAMKDGQVTRQATPPVNIIVVGFRPTRFVEKVVGSADRGQIVKTERDVQLAGGTLDWAEWNLKKASGMKLFQPLADAFLVIERPESLASDNTNFTYEVEGRFYALALWAMKGTSYTAAAKRVFFTGRRIGILRQEGYPSWVFSLATREDTFGGGNKAWTPICLPKEKTSPAMLSFIGDVLSTPSAEPTDDEAAAAAASAE